MGFQASKTETVAQKAARYAEEDFKRLKAWCDDKWWWNCAVVTLMTISGEKTEKHMCVGRLASDDEQGLEEIKLDLAQELSDEVADSHTLVRLWKIREVPPPTPKEELQNFIYPTAKGVF